MANSIVTSKTFLAYSLGCRTNQAEIETISLQLTDCSLRQITRNEIPDIVLLNTCVVTQKAEKETRQKIRELRTKYPNALLVILGCAVTAKEKLKILLPEADLLIPNEQKGRTIKIIEQKIYSNKQMIHCNFENKYILSGRKFIKIQDGCSGGCSFCLTQFVRGKPTSAPPEKIIEEINFWIEKGIKEIILTGINIGLYNPTDRYTDRYHTCHITDLLNKILSETKVERISFSSIDPEILLSAKGSVPSFINNSRISQYFHLSLQSGSSSVLKRMNRETDLKELLTKLGRIKKQNPFFSFRADIIVGFPNETEKEFQETLDFIKKTKISFVHIFPFSPRKGTIAYEMIKSKKWNEVPKEIKRERVGKIRKVVEETRNNEAKKMTGLKQNCLIVRSLSRYIVEGISENGWPVLVKSSKACPEQVEGLKVKSYKGKILPVRITGFEGNYLLGEITSLPTSSRKTSGTSIEPSAF